MDAEPEGGGAPAGSRPGKDPDLLHETPESWTGGKGKQLYKMG